MGSRPRHARSAVVAGVLLTCACSARSTAGGSGSASVTGTVSGHAIPTNNAVGIDGTTTINGPVQPTAGARIADVGNVCTALQTNSVAASSKVLDVSVVANSGAVMPGDYKLNGAGGIGGAVTFTVQDQNCNPTLQSSATVGSVTLTTVSTSTVAGSFDVTFPTGDHVTGTFSAPVCAFSSGADAAAQGCAQ